MSYATTFAIFDPGGNLWAVGFRKIQPPGSIMAAELQAMQDGLLFGKHHRPGPFRILSDSLEAIHAVLSEIQYERVEELLIKDIKSHINDSAVKEVWYCQRKFNVAAHKLAKLATSSPHPQAWMSDDIPRHIMSIALSI